MDLFEQKVLGALEMLEKSGKIKSEPCENGDDKWDLENEEAKK